MHGSLGHGVATRSPHDCSELDLYQSLHVIPVNLIQRSKTLDFLVSQNQDSGDQEDYKSSSQL